MVNKNIKEKAFTLIELLVVIAIISILAAILFVAINPAEQSNKAKAIRIISDLKMIEKSFALTALEKNRETYPLEGDIPGSDHIHIMVNNGELINLPKNLRPNGLGNNYYLYDNDGDVYPYLNNCPGSTSPKGVNIFVSGNDANDVEVWKKMDEILDGGDGIYCGRIRSYSSTTWGYVLDANQ